MRERERERGSDKDEKRLSQDCMIPQLQANNISLHNVV